MAGGFQSGITARTYKPGSIIYFENDKSEYIYILKSGRVLLTYTKIDTGEEIKEEVRQGEFFGVKSALGKYPREETAQTIGETVVLVLTMADFERMILKNVNVVRKMLRVFSNQLRRIGRTVRTVLGESDTVNPEFELFRIGEHYFKAGDFAKASYAFKKYMEYYPDTDYSKMAMDRIRVINSGGAADITAKPVSQTKQADTEDDSLPDFSMDDEDNNFSIDDTPAAPKVVKSEPVPLKQSIDSSATALSSEMDDFLADDSQDMDDFGDFDFDVTPDKKGGSLKEKYENGISQLDMDNHSEALNIFKTIIDEGEPSDPQSVKYFQDSYFNAALCAFKMKSYKDAMNYFSEIIKNQPDSDRMKETLFYIGQIFELTGQKNKAVAYYQKITNMQPKDSLSSKAMDRIRAIQKG